MKQSKSYEMDMCHGPIMSKLLVFSLPLMLSGVLQLLFNAADVIVVGQYVGSTALAAVGSTGSLINLLINLLIGLSVGANVVVARFYGAKEEEKVSQAVHTATLLSLVCSVVMVVVGIVLAEPLLTLMGTPDTVLGQAALYMRIYFAGLPVIMLYNFGSAILRAVGDTKRPMYFLVIAGVINVILNLIFVIVFHLGVAGVALATVISQCVSAALVMLCLIRSTSSIQLHLKKLRIHKEQLLAMIRVGLPAGLQGMVFSISNVLIQSSVNSFGDLAMAGNAAGSNIEGFIYTCMNAVYQACLSFTSQNYGAGQYKRIRKIRIQCLLLVTVVGMLLGAGALFGAPVLLRLYSTDPEVIQYGIMRMQIICLTYFTCGWMDVMVGTMRGIGYSLLPMVVSLAGACGLRVVWIFTIFQWKRSLQTLYISYPVSWVITAAVHILCFYIVSRKMPKNDMETAEAK